MQVTALVVRREVVTWQRRPVFLEMNRSCIWPIVTSLYYRAEVQAGTHTGDHRNHVGKPESRSSGSRCTRSPGHQLMCLQSSLLNRDSPQGFLRLIEVGRKMFLQVPGCERHTGGLVICLLGESQMEISTQ